MDDDARKPPRKSGARPGGRPAGGGKPFGTKPRSGSKPSGSKPAGGNSIGGKGFGGKPRPSGGRPGRTGEAAAGAKRPERAFKSDAPRGEHSERSFAKGPRTERKPFVKREDTGTERPKREFKPDGDRAQRPDRQFSKGPPRERKPFVKREDSATERPKRDFKPDGDRAPRPDRQFSKGPPRERKPFVKREDAGTERFPKDFPQSEDAAGGERPFFKRARPGRNERDARRGDGAPRERKPFAPRETTVVEEGERIAKRLARAGIASRRDAEALITDGRVKVNGEVLTSPARNVLPSDRIELDNAEIPAIERTRLFLFNKPAGLVTTNRDPEGRRTIFDALPGDMPRVITIGRLDINTEGLLLLTNDGGLARVLELPATGWLRRYRVRVHGDVDEKALQALREGVAVDGVFYGSIEASLDRSQGSNAWLTLGLREGKNREVKNVLGSLGLEVTRLIRISYGPFQLGELADGAVLEIKGKMLRDQLGERLIEESGANFEAPINMPFSNSPVRGERRAPREERDEPRPTAPRRSLDVSEGGLVKNNWRNRDQIREQALERLQTKPGKKGQGGKSDFAKDDFGPRAFGKAKPAFAKRPAGDAKERDANRADPAKPRTANVWMASGARPTSKKPSGDAHAPSAKGPRKAESAKPFGAKSSRGDAARGGDRPRPGKPRGPRKTGKPG